MCFFFKQNTESAPVTMVIYVERLSGLYCLWKGKSYQITTSLCLGLFVQVFDLITLVCELLVLGPIYCRSREVLGYQCDI
jgi:hypothetical protein